LGTRRFALLTPTRTHRYRPDGGQDSRVYTHARFRFNLLNVGTCWAIPLFFDTIIVVPFARLCRRFLLLRLSLIPSVGTFRLPHIPLPHTRPPSSNQQILFWGETISSPLQILPLKRFEKKYIYSTCSKTRGTPYMAIHALSHLSIWS
jgi:hypothetical protein